jgi:UDP-glucose 4-epimerase
MQIAVTGSSGRIGRAVTTMALADGHQVVAIDRLPPNAEAAPPHLTFVQADIAEYTEVEQALRGCEAVIHLAAIPGPFGDPDHVVHDNNVVGSYHVLRAAAGLGIRRICQASSINAIGASFSRWPRYDYFPLDEQHPTYNEDPYSLSKWICEQQADSLARFYDALTIASLRFHWVVPERPVPTEADRQPDSPHLRHLWGYTRLNAAARACLLSLTANVQGHEAFYIVAPETTQALPSIELARKFFPDVPVRGDLSGRRGFFNCAKAERLLGWRHVEA